MENNLLISLSHQMALKRRMDTIANNMANMNTAGYKADGLMFQEHVMPVARAGGIAGAGGRLSYVQDGAMVRDFAAGPLDRTGGELDVAISGEGWFVVDTPDGERYTRNGQFKLDADGRLVTGEGYPVLGEGGAIVFAPEEVGVEIADDATISTSQGRKDRFRLVRFDNDNELRKAGASLFASDAAARPADEARVVQGMIEKSNVAPVLELTRMIETLRAYTQAAQAIEGQHELRRTAIERLGDTTHA